MDLKNVVHQYKCVNLLLEKDLITKHIHCQCHWKKLYIPVVTSLIARFHLSEFLYMETENDSSLVYWS